MLPKRSTEQRQGLRRAMHPLDEVNAIALARPRLAAAVNSHPTRPHECLVKDRGAVAKVGWQKGLLIPPKKDACTHRLMPCTPQCSALIPIKSEWHDSIHMSLRTHCPLSLTITVCYKCGRSVGSGSGCLVRVSCVCVCALCPVLSSESRLCLSHVLMHPHTFSMHKS